MRSFAFLPYHFFGVFMGYLIYCGEKLCPTTETDKGLQGCPVQEVLRNGYQLLLHF